MKPPSSTAPVEVIGPEDLHARLGDLDGPLLDLCMPQDWEQGHIEGAVHVDVRELKERIAELAPETDQPVYLYCKKGLNAAIGEKILVELGYSRIRIMRGGKLAWQQAGYTLVES